MHSPLPNSQIEFTHIARQVVLYNRKRESAFGMKTQCKQMRVPRTNTSTEVRAQVPKYEYKYPSTNTNTEYKHKYRCFLSTLHAVTLSRDLLTSQTACMHTSTDCMQASHAGTDRMQAHRSTDHMHAHIHSCMTSFRKYVHCMHRLLTSQTACMHASTAAWPLFIIIHTATNGKHSLAMQPHTFAVARPAY